MVQEQMVIDVPANMKVMLAKKDWQGIVDMFSFVQPISNQDDAMMQLSINMNIAMAYSQMMKYGAMEEHYIKAVKYAESGLTDKEAMDMRYCLSIAQLHNGKLKAGFYNYAFRWVSTEMEGHMASMLNKGVPYVSRWSEIVGKRLFVSGEQGFGDELMFSRALIEAAKVTQSIFKLTPKPLQEFFAINFTDSTQMVPEKLSTLPKGFIKDNYDCIISVGDLLRLYVLEHDALPPVPLYRSRKVMEVPGDKPKVGFIYSPGKMGDTIHIRAIAPDTFKQFSEDFQLYCFQVGEYPGYGRNVGEKLKSFSDTADYLSAMDCTLTCDTAFAHLSLCMGKPTMLVYDDYVDWRFNDKIGMYPKVVKVSTKDEHFSEKVRDFVNGCGDSHG